MKMCTLPDDKVLQYSEKNMIDEGVFNGVFIRYHFDTVADSLFSGEPEYLAVLTLPKTETEHRVYLLKLKNRFLVL